jgi:hypothetical protein
MTIFIISITNIDSVLSEKSRKAVMGGTRAVVLAGALPSRLVRGFAACTQECQPWSGVEF